MHSSALKVWHTNHYFLLAEHGIETGIHYKPIHQMSMYKTKQKLPITENVGKKIISLPTHPNLSKNEITEVISVINKNI